MQRRKNVEDPEQAIIKLIGAYQGSLGEPRIERCLTPGPMNPPVAFIVAEGNGSQRKIPQSALPCLGIEICLHSGLDSLCLDFAFNTEDPYPIIKPGFLFDQSHSRLSENSLLPHLAAMQ